MTTTTTTETLATDDRVIAFQTVASGMSGRIVRLGPAVDEILSKHDYPEPVSKVLGQALALTAMLGSQLKFDGKLILQTNSSGPLGFLVVNYNTGGAIRGYASFDREAIKALEAAGPVNEADLLGKGYLAMTIDPGGDMERYQGIVALDGDTLAEAALEYFRQSEQLPTFIKLSVARHYAANPSAGGGKWHWRAGGIMVQHLTAQGGKSGPDGVDDSNLSYLAGTDDDNWNRVEILASTAQDHELLDPTLTPDRLLFRLFHEEGVAVNAPQPIVMRCGCSRDAVANMLHRFGKAELADMRDASGHVLVTCEFCSTAYTFTDADLE